ncbi:Hypothetical protein R9X50_00752300 [Acrodontium crateriforme]|uniref:DUF221-domain-containing protein n=1 Tax=Acrodontium crateriforme TaxID=150365 RepID=A0AAQ3MBB2_9PEZI|nr:Hypothetical protein R9X50_00752300 [Acrodontium crateriforme]
MAANMMDAAKMLLKREGSSSGSSSNSASNLYATVLPVAIGAGVWFTLFIVFRRIFKRNYQARSVISSLRPEERSPQLSDSMFGWIKEFLNMRDDYILQHHTLDGYLFLRFLKLSVVICFVGCVITWPVLFPVTATGGAGGSQLDLLAMGNVNNFWRYWAHAGCAVIFFGFVMYMITRETVYYINLKQAYLLAPGYASRISTRTVLFASVPQEYMNETKLRDMFGAAVRRVWLVTDTEELEELVDRRDKAAMKLEGAETKLIRTANANRLKAQKKGAKTNGDAAHEEAAVGESSNYAQWLDAKKRPTHKLKLFGLCGAKVDTIDWSRNELQQLIPEVNKTQAEHKAQKAKMLTSAFIEFDTVNAAQAAYQMVAHHQALHMAPRYAGPNPNEIIWKNLRINWKSRIIRGTIATTICVALVVLWIFPIIAVGSISNIQQLTHTKYFTWLSFLEDIPKPIEGVVSGLLPSILLAIVMMLPPIILRMAAKFGGALTRSQIELTVQNYFFAFQIVEVFFFATLGSALPQVAAKIAQSPTSAPSALAQNIPKAYTLYLSYFIVQGLAVVSGLLVGLVGLLLFKLLGKFLDGTPRKMYKRWISLSGLGWGTLFPVQTGLLCIAIIYSILAPLVTGFAVLGLSLFYLAYKYNLLFVYNIDIDTKGRVYPRALQQLFVGLYVAEVTLIGLFAVSIGGAAEHHPKGAIGPLILMIIMLVFTALYQSGMNSALSPLVEYLPTSIEAEERRLQGAEKTQPIEGSANGGPSNDIHEKDGQVDESSPITPSTQDKGNMLTRFLKPHVYCDYAAMRKIVPQSIAVRYTPEDEEHAYFNPAIASQTPLLWIPRDSMGLSRDEVRDTSKVIPITDDGAYLDEKNKIVWDADGAQPPIYQEAPYY